MERLALFGMILAWVILCTGSTPVLAQEKHDPGVSPGSRISIQAERMPLGEVLAAFAKQSGNRPLVVPADLRKLPVTLRVTDLPYWQAMDRLCESSGLIVVPDLKSGRLRIDRAVRREDLGAHNGCLVVKVEEIRRRKEYRVIRKLRPRWGPEELRCVYRYFWEDRLPVIDARAEIVEVTGPDGRRLYKFQIPVPTPHQVHFERGPRPPTGTLVVYHARLPKDLPRLGEVTGVVRLRIGVGRRQLVFKDVIARPGATGAADDMTLTLKNVQREDDVIRIVVEAEITGPKAKLCLGTYGPPFGFFLEGPGGKRLSAEIEHRARRLRRENGDAKAGDAWKGTVGRIDLHLRFALPTGARGVWTLVYVYPENIRTEQADFRIKDIPIR